ncbi:GTP cyclohydrolase 1 [Paraphaeosphaeria minitans]
MVGKNKHEDDDEKGLDFCEGGSQDYCASNSLSWLRKITRKSDESTEIESDRQLARLSGAVRTILECIGEDVDREGLLDTPARYAQALFFFTKGYEDDLASIVNNAVFKENHNGLVLVKNIEIFSMCEHHMVPFTGKMHIGYIPSGHVIGLSKLARIAEMFSRRLQIQERLTKQVASAVFEILKPQGVAVLVECSHLCMVMRGVEKTSTTTITSSMLGSMQSDMKTQQAFLDLVKL